ncbi:MAG: DUF3179 domain-containing protein [Chitinophagaceae bacterium]|nr:DUF3179 domain-containing protein [Chitinophagaceae bacterium]
MNKGILATGLILLIALEISGIYFIMPFPGSQKTNSLPLAYWLHNNIMWIRILLLAVVLWFFIKVFRNSGWIARSIFSLLLVVYGFMFYKINFKFQADKMFYQPKTKEFADASFNKVDGNRLVIGVLNNGEAKAYPIQVIGYHHQVRDTVGGTPVIVTYCTVCRTGRVFSPEVSGKPETFRLVGMDHFNAMFEDATTKSWWQQATGVAVAGKLKGAALKEIPSQQSQLRTFLLRYPNAVVLQPDTLYKRQYRSLRDFDNGTTKDGLEKRDSASWEFKSWVVGVEHNGNAIAYDWNMLASERIIQDSLPGAPLLVTLENDTASFHVLNRKLDNDILQFVKLPGNMLSDTKTGSYWSPSGLCIDGAMKGVKLSRLQASQEFWHSWKSFHPTTRMFKK